MRVPYTEARQVATALNARQGEACITPEDVQRVAHGLPLTGMAEGFERSVRELLEEKGYDLDGC